MKINPVLYLELFYTLELPREILVYFSHGHSAKTQTSLRIKQSFWSLCPIVNANLDHKLLSELPSKYERFRHTGWSIKESWDVSGVDLFIYFFTFNLFYFILFNFFLLECLWSAKMLRIEGQLAFTKPHLLRQFIFHQEPVLDQTMTTLLQNTIGRKFLDFNCILF